MAYSVSVVMIVRNEERSLARCLSSVQGLVDEIVVVDTGSTDRTVAIAEEHGAKVFHFDWIDDFSAARNHSLDQATGDWRLVLDADEWLTSDPVQIRGLRTEPPTFVGYVEQVSYVEVEQRRGLISAWLARLLPRGVGFTGTIHEQVLSALPTSRVPIAVRHDGYTEGDKEARAARNVALLRTAVTTASEEILVRYYRYQLGKELAAAHDSAGATAEFEQAWSPEFAGTPWGFEAGQMWMQTAVDAGDVVGALKAAEMLGEHYADKAAYWYSYARALLLAGNADPGRSSTFAQAAFTALQTCLQLGDDQDGMVTVHGAGSFLAAELMAELLRATGRVAEAEQLDEVAARLRARAVAGPTA